MKRLLAIPILCFVLLACTEKRAEEKLEQTTVETHESKTTLASHKYSKSEESSGQKNTKTTEAKNKEQKVRFIEPPQVVSDPSDPSYSLREPYGDPGEPVVGMAEPIEVQEPPQEEILQYAEEMPEYPGGTQALMDYLKANIKYPAQAKDEGIQGTVYIGFVVYKDGTLGNFKIRRGIRQDLDKEAMRVLKAMPKWKPGKQNGKTVNCEMTIPVKFRLD